MSDAFTITTMPSSREIRTITRELTRLRDDELANLPAAQDWEDFKRRAGRLSAFTEALEIVNDVVDKEQG